MVLVLAAIAAITSPTKAAEISAALKKVRDKIDLKAPDGLSHIHGFNYQPSWAHNFAEVWGEKFNPDKYREELVIGKKLFPKINAVRIWLSWDAYRANSERTTRNFQKAVDICANLDLLVVPVIFNRCPDLGEEVKPQEVTADLQTMFAPFVNALVAPMKGDLRILAWDLCNEPFASDVKNELKWLTNVRDAIKQIDPNALICIGTMPGLNYLGLCGHLQDILTPHLYYPLYENPPKTRPAKLEDTRVPKSVVVESFEYAKKVGKPMMTTECCWGSFDDAERVRIIRTNLGLMKEYGIGFFPHALWTSGIADLNHKDPGHKLYMPFILEDGSIRPGHEVYNDYTQ
jgi:hypothetical protein